MKKIKLLMFGILSVLTLGIFAICTKVNAQTVSFTYSAYSDTLQTTEGGTTNISNISNNEGNGWYNPSAVSGVSISTEYYLSYASASNGVITKIGNSTEALVSNIPTKYKTNITITSTNTVGYVCAMSPVDGINQIDIVLNNTKGNSGESFILVTCDGTNYYKYGDTLNTANLSINQTITLAQINSTLEANNVAEASTNTSMGYAIILTAAKNIYTSTWTSTIYKDVEVTSNYYDVYFHDIDGNVLSDLTSNVEENTLVTKPTAPYVWLNTFNYWATLDNSTYTKFDFENTVITGETHLYAVYSEIENAITDPNTLDLSLMGYGYSSLSESTSTSNRELTGTIYTLLSGNTRFYSTSKTVADLGTSSAAVNTGGGFSSSNIKNGIRINPTTDGTLSMYVYCSNDRACLMLDSNKEEINSGQTTGKATMTLVQYDLEANKTYNFGSSDGSIYIYYASFIQDIADTVTFSGATVQGTSTADTTKGAVRFLGKLENVALADITSIKVSVQITDYSVHEFDVENVYTSITGFDNATAADNTLYFYFSVYDLDSTFNSNVFNFSAEITYSDSSVFTSETYSITYVA